MTAARDRSQSAALLTIGGLLLVAVYVGALFRSAATTPYDIWGAFLVAPLLVAATVPLARRMARAEGDPRIARLVLLALVAKLAASLVRYTVAFDVYGGVADASAYAEAGARLAPLYRLGLVSADLGAPLVGTGFLRLVTGMVFAVIGPTTLGGFLVFSWFGFWGMYCFFRAFRVGYPDGDWRRYALLVFFLPSLLFWPSSIGKEAWMVASLGVAAYGAARLLTARGGGAALLVVGLAGGALVRPHMAVLLAGSAAIAFLLRRSPGQASPVAPVTKLLGAVAMAAVCVLLLIQAARFFQVEGRGLDAVDSVLSQTQDQTSQGGSEFDAVRVRSPLQLPQALLTVLYRPFPFEATSVPTLVASLEGLGLLGITLLSLDRLRVLPRKLLSSPFLTFCAVYTLLFATVFSTFGNFGLLTRQRAQLFPFVLVFLALAPVPRRLATWRARNHPPARRLVDA